MRSKNTRAERKRKSSPQTRKIGLRMCAVGRSVASCCRSASFPIQSAELSARLSRSPSRPLCLNVSPFFVVPSFVRSLIKARCRPLLFAVDDDGNDDGDGGGGNEFGWLRFSDTLYSLCPHTHTRAPLRPSASRVCSFRFDFVFRSGRFNAKAVALGQMRARVAPYNDSGTDRRFFG